MPDVGGVDFSPDELRALDETQGDRVKRELKKGIGIGRGIISMHSKKIIVVLVAVVLVYFAYDFFIGSIKEVSVTVSDLEGRPVENAFVTIKDSQGETVFDGERAARHSTNLRQGVYEVRVIATGFKTSSRQIELMEDESIAFQLEKDSHLSVESVILPDRLFLGQEFILRVRLKNSGSTSESAELDLSGELEKFNCELSEIMVPARGDETVSVYCRVPDTIEIQHVCDQKNAAVGIKLLRGEESTSFELCQTPQITLQGLAFNVTPVTNPKERRNVTIRNNSTFPVEDLELSVEITSANENDPTEALEWFSFSNSEQDPMNQRIISSIRARGRADEPLEVDVPYTARAETIYGNIVLRAPFLKEAIRESFTLVIRASAEAELRFDLGQENITIRDVREGVPQEQTVNISVTNRGTLAVEGIEIRVRNPAECSSDWLKRFESPFIRELRPGQSETVVFIASAPKEAEEWDSARCTMEAVYENPLPPYEDVTERLGLITITRR